MYDKQPFFSIVIANYNHAEYIEDAIVSILTQSCRDYELIIVDGGSTDKSVDIIEEYDDRIKWWVSEKDHGQSDAFNKGFKHADGKFYFWLNADDILLPDSLKEAKKFLQSNLKCNWLIGNCLFFNKDRYILKCTRAIKFIPLLKDRIDVSVNGPTSIFSKEYFEESGGFDISLQYTMDIDLWIRFLNCGHRYKIIDHYFWGFRIHGKSKTSHAFEGKADLKFLNERKFLKKKYSYHNYILANLLLKMYKIISGRFFLSYFDTLRMRGKDALIDI